MKSIVTTVLFLTTSIVFGQTSFHYQNDFKKILTQTKDVKNDLFYDTLVNRFLANDTTLSDYEVLALLIGFTDKPAYKPYQDIDTEREIYKLNGDKKYQEGLTKGLSFIKTHPLSVKTLFEIAYAHHKLNNEDSAHFYTYRGRRIFEAMYFSGTGKTIETPTFALGPADGQDYIHKFVPADIGVMGSGSDKDGNFLDMLEAKFEDGSTVQLYFIIQHATNKMADGRNITDELKKQDKKKKN